MKSYRSVFVLALSCILSLHRTDSCQPASLDVPNCGVKSVLRLAERWGNAVSEDRRNVLRARYPFKRVRMMDVKNAANFLGLNLEGQQITLPELQRLNRPFIAATTDHFVLVDGMTNEWVRVFEEPELKLVRRADFARDYTGKSLTLESSMWRRHGVIRVDKPVLDVGTIPLNTTSIAVTINLRNAGGKLVKIDRVEPSCTCTVPSTAPTQIASGQAVPLVLNIAVPSAGNVDVGVKIFSDALNHIEDLKIVGVVEKDILLSPARLYLSDTVLGSEVTRNVTLYDPMRKMRRPLAISTDSETLSARLKQVGQDKFQIEVKYRANSSVGAAAIENAVFVHSADKKRPALKIPVFGEIVFPLQGTPSQVILGPSDETGGKTVEIRRRDGKPFNINRVVVPALLASQAEPLGADRTKWIISVRPMAGLQIENGKDVLRVESTQEKSVLPARTDIVEIPLLRLVEQNIQPAPLDLPSAEEDPANVIATAIPLVRVGESAPEFDVVDKDGTRQRLSNFRGRKNVLLTFFPKCFTGGCANHLSSLRDKEAEFDAVDTQILAISVDFADGVKGQKEFAKQWRLPFPLVPDVSRKLSMLYGAAQDKAQLAARMSVLIDKQGIVRFVDTNVHVKTHAADSLAKMRELGIGK